MSPRPPLRLLGLALLTAVLLAGLPAAAGAQPFSAFLFLPSPGFLSVPDSPALNPTGAFTFEAWVNLTNSSGSSCSSIAGKNWMQAWWIGICGTNTLRSYIKGSSSLYDAGVIPAGEWNHIAVVFDGAHRFHYVNGELVGTPHADTGPLTTSTAPVEIGSDFAYPHTPVGGAIDEVRLWNVARTQAQIQAAMRGLSSAPPGLVAIWLFNSSPNDSFGGHNGTLQGGATYGFNGTGSSCAPAADATHLCLSGRFLITTKYRTGPQSTAEGIGQVAQFTPVNPGSGLFWFFDASNWEVMVKAINGCGLSSTYWIFSAATTNVFYRMDVYDYHSGQQRIYFNYPGPPAPAVTDTSAFATCP